MNFPTLFKITPEPFALDLSDRSIKIVKLSRRKGGIFLENFGEFGVEKGVMEDGVIADERKLANIIRGAIDNLTRGPLATPYVACSVPEEKTYLRIVQLPKMKKEEIQAAIEWEVEANIPEPLNELYFDWRVLPQTRKNTDHFDILVSAAPKEIIDAYTRLFIVSGLKPFSFEPESVAIARSVIKGGFSSKPVLIVDLGRNRTSLVVYAGYGLRLSSSVKLSGAVITSNIMKAMNIGEDEAVRLKEEVGVDQRENETLYEAVIPMLNDFKQQIQSYIEFYSTSFDSGHAHETVPQIVKILLCGGGTRMRGLEKHLTLSLGLPVEIANPWVNILTPPLKELPELPFIESVRYATALGLALGNI